MSAKKKKRPGAAQQLIDELLDEKTPAPSSVIDASDSFKFGELSKKTSKPDSARHSDKDLPVIDLGDDDENNLVLESPQPNHNDPVYKKVPAPQAGANTSEATATASVRPVPSPKGKPNANAAKNDLDKTMQIESSSRPFARDLSENLSRTEVVKNRKADDESEIDRGGVTELKTVVKLRDRENSEPEVSQKTAQRMASGSSNAFTSSEAALKQSENLRIAQGRISELEHELERLRRENEGLATAGDTLSRRTDELVSKCEQLEMQTKEAKELHEDEKKFFRSQVQAKERENADLRARLEEMEGRLESNFKKIRVRERELEHRLEIVRMESATLVATKDKMLLDLKRQIDQLTHENEYAKQKSQELFNQFKGKQETIVRVVRALRMALDYLEGADDSNKKD